VLIERRFGGSTLPVNKANAGCFSAGRIWLFNPPDGLGVVLIDIGIF
jgi:hypothetical protein